MQHDSAKWTPSIINATKSSPDKFVSSSSARAVSVIATKRRETADLLVAEDVSVTCAPTGSSPTAYRRVESPASIFSIAILPRISVELNSS
jgi:hypothetical protein